MPKEIYQTIHIHPQAPAKPALHAACNGCGVCCASEPCPVAMFWLWQFKGTCRALIWHDNHYRCGLVNAPQNYIPLLPHRWAKPFGNLIAQRISSGSGCDFAATIEER